MNERTLEERTADAVERVVEGRPLVDCYEDMRLAISTALTLARREGYLVYGNARSVDAATAYPLPTRTMRVLREVRDPEGLGVTYRFVPSNDEEEVSFHADNGLVVRGGACPFPTPERIALWHDLMQRPFHEESVPVDPSEILP